jgi:siroheme synthase-like protein
MLFPLFLRLEGKRVLVVGGGTVAEKKAIDLADAGARVNVVAPEISGAIAGDDRITKEQRGFEESDVDGAWLVVAATSDPITQKRACEAADSANLFSIAVDDPPNGSAYSASVLRRGPFTVAISTTGEAPALTRLLR